MPSVSSAVRAARCSSPILAIRSALLGVIFASALGSCAQEVTELPPLPPDKMLINVSVDGVTSNIKSLAVTAEGDRE